jgi:hypothetical protein
MRVSRLATLTISSLLRTAPLVGVEETKSVLRRRGARTDVFFGSGHLFGPKR